MSQKEMATLNHRETQSHVEDMEVLIKHWLESAREIMRAYRENEIRNAERVRNEEGSKFPPEMEIIDDFIQTIAWEYAERAKTGDRLTKEELLERLKLQLLTILSQDGDNPEETLKKAWVLIEPIGVTLEDVFGEELEQILEENP